MAMTGQQRSAAWRQRHPGRASAQAHAWTQRHPEKRRAHVAVKRAVKSGTLTPPKTCVCGGSPVEAHHADYAKPLDVTWLCRVCHRRDHHGE